MKEKSKTIEKKGETAGKGQKLREKKIKEKGQKMIKKNQRKGQKMVKNQRKKGKNRRKKEKK